MFSFGKIPKRTIDHVQQLGWNPCPSAAAIFGQFIQKVMMHPGVSLTSVKSWPVSVLHVKTDRVLSRGQVGQELFGI